MKYGTGVGILATLRIRTFSGWAMPISFAQIISSSLSLRPMRSAIFSLCRTHHIANGNMMKMAIVMKILLIKPRLCLLELLLLLQLLLLLGIRLQTQSVECDEA